MGFNLSKPLAINGFVNLLVALKAAGYTGDAKLMVQAFLDNEDAAVNCFIHFTNDGSTSAGLTGTDGLRFGPAAGTPSKTFVLPKNTDLSTTWLFSASAISVKAGVQN